MVVGPPGIGKTDTAVQILNVLYQNCSSWRTLIITHLNQALNDLFEKKMVRDVPAHYILRLGQGEQELVTDLDFSCQGRVNAMLVRRLELLSEVERLGRSLQLHEDVGYTFELGRSLQLPEDVGYMFERVGYICFSDHLIYKLFGEATNCYQKIPRRTLVIDVDSGGKNGWW